MKMGVDGDEGMKLIEVDEDGWLNIVNDQREEQMISTSMTSCRVANEQTKEKGE